MPGFSGTHGNTRKQMKSNVHQKEENRVQGSYEGVCMSAASLSASSHPEAARGLFPLLLLLLLLQPWCCHNLV